MGVLSELGLESAEMVAAIEKEGARHNLAFIPLRKLINVETGEPVSEAAARQLAHETYHKLKIGRQAE